MILILILLVFAFVLATIAAVWNPAPPSPWFGRLVAAALAFYFAAEIIIHYPTH